MKKVLMLVIVVSILAVSSASFGAAKKTSAASAPAATFDNVGIVDMNEVFSSHPKLNQILQQVNNIGRQKENEARAAAEKETDTAKKAQAVQTKRMEFEQERQKLTAPIYRDCQQALREVAARKKLVLVFDKLLVLIGGVDITQDVIQQLAKSK